MTPTPWASQKLPATATSDPVWGEQIGDHAYAEKVATLGAAIHRCHGMPSNHGQQQYQDYYDPEGKLILSNEDGVTTTYSTPTPTTTL